MGAPQQIETCGNAWQAPVSVLWTVPEDVDPPLRKVTIRFHTAFRLPIYGYFPLHENKLVPREFRSSSRKVYNMESYYTQCTQADRDLQLAIRDQDLRLTLLHRFDRIKNLVNRAKDVGIRVQILAQSIYTKIKTGIQALQIGHQTVRKLYRDYNSFR